MISEDIQFAVKSPYEFFTAIYVVAVAESDRNCVAGYRCFKERVI